MTESVYKVIELIGTSNEWKRPPRPRSSELQNPSAASCRGSRRTRLATRLQGKDRGLSRQAERLIQVRGHLSPCRDASHLPACREREEGINWFFTMRRVGKGAQAPCPPSIDNRRNYNLFVPNRTGTEALGVHPSLGGAPRRCHVPLCSQSDRESRDVAICREVPTAELAGCGYKRVCQDRRMATQIPISPERSRSKHRVCVRNAMLWRNEAERPHQGLMTYN